MKKTGLIIILSAVIVGSILFVGAQLNRYVSIEAREETMVGGALSAAEIVFTKIGEFFGWIEPTPTEEVFDFPAVDY